MSRIKSLNVKTKKNISSGDSVYIKIIFFAVTYLIFFTVIILPVSLVAFEATKKGYSFFIKALEDPAALSAVLLTLKVALIVVPLNTIFGIAIAWAVTKFEFKGKTLLTSFLDIPFAVSPVIAGLLFILTVGSRTPFGGWLNAHGIQVIFAFPGIVLATVFVTFPFVARELISLMQSQGKEEEEAAMILGASGWQIFTRVTLPNIKWGLLYGIILCNARAIGEFGAVSVVSGHIRGYTNTIPLHVEILYSEYQITASFAVSSILVLMALVTLAVKSFIEYMYRSETQSSEA
jgi:sulfate transport system permease protein